MAVTDTKTGAGGGHLDYYKQHGISPVSYKTDNMRAHLERRDSLYRSIGLPPVAFKGVRILEVAPGTGQNSLYLAMCQPRSLDLVEPNPAGLAAIEKTYESFTLPHTRPHIHPVRLEEFQPAEPYDIVLCENWLGNLPHERKLIGKLASLVAPGGVMVLTIVPYIGFFPNVMRKLIAMRLVPPAMEFEAKTRALTEAFGPHLSTIANMTRSHRDWVHDCLINPHYLNVALPLESVLDAVGPEMEALGTFPRAASDWRWFKGLTGSERKFNEVLGKSLREESHNFLDYRKLWPKRSDQKNAALEATCMALHGAALAWQSAFENNDARLPGCTADISRLIDELSPQLAEIDGELAKAMSELRSVWNAPAITAPMVSGMKTFGTLFGRETVYLSLAADCCVTRQAERAMSGIHIGIDLDNTLIDYDDVFGPIAENISLFDKGTAPGSKEAVKAQLIARDPSEKLWMRLQGQVYGRYIGMAQPCAGATEFLAAMRTRGVRVSIVSHKTRFGHFDTDEVNLWDAARGWLVERGFLGPDGYGISEADVHFEETRDAKIARIASIGCRIFVDDLEEVLTHPAFPGGVQRIWYAAKQPVDEKKRHLEPYRDWREIMDKVGKTL